MGGRLLWGRRSSPSPSNGRSLFLRQNVPPFYHQWEATFFLVDCPFFYHKWEAAFSGAEGPPILPTMGGILLSGGMSTSSTIIWRPPFQAEGPSLLPAMGGRLLWGRRSPPSLSDGRPHSLRQNVTLLFPEMGGLLLWGRRSPPSSNGRPPFLRQKVFLLN